ncbi:MAG: LysE family transporter [Candidatus Omnitrophica bacterium]|nr:LysE family transporter [Candidatus Omnitrophota bacterium]
MIFILLFIIGLGTGLSGAMIPGPLFLFTVSESLKKDSAVGLRIAIGHIIIEALFVVMIFLGFKNMLTSDGFMRLVSGLGGIALIVMGIVLLYGAAKMTLQVKDGVEFDYGAVVGGAFFSIVSPGFLIWWSTIGLSVVLKSLLFGLAGLTMVALGHWTADIGWHWFVSYFVNKRKYSMEDEPYRNVMRLLALGLVATGIYFCFGISI